MTCRQEVFVSNMYQDILAYEYFRTSIEFWQQWICSRFRDADFVEPNHSSRSVPLINKEGLGEVLLEKLFSTPHFTEGYLNGY